MTRPTDYAALAKASSYAIGYRQNAEARPVHPSADARELRKRLCVDLPDGPRDGEAVLADLIAGAEPGLVGNTQGDFFAWVMGGSHPVGVAADWLTSAWGQNAAIYQTSPAAAVAEEAVSAWLLDLLRLPEEASVGFVTGATMAAFVGLAAARTEVLSRVGWCYDEDGLQGAPLIHVFLSEDAHVTNHTALRHLGFGARNCVRVTCDAEGRMDPNELQAEMRKRAGPKIIIAQAGHINSGAFEDFQTISRLAKAEEAWLHVDGAFGLWARAVPEMDVLTAGLELADSWSVDGHKWLQVPYDSGFAIVRDGAAHKRAMDTSASYLNEAPEDGRNPTQLVPELSRRARGFAAWAVLQTLGREGIRELILRHCELAQLIASEIKTIPGLDVAHNVHLNQVSVSAKAAHQDPMIERLAEELNARTGLFLKTARWRGRTILRISVCNRETDAACASRLVASLREHWGRLLQRSELKGSVLASLARLPQGPDERGPRAH